MTYDVFLSHRGSEIVWVRCLADNLRMSGFSVFLDEIDADLGEGFITSLSDAIRSSRNGVVIVSPDAVEAGWLREECDTMLRLQDELPEFRFLLVLVGSLPFVPFASCIEYVDFRRESQDSYRSAFEQLRNALDEYSEKEYKTLGKLVFPDKLEGRSARGRGDCTVSLLERLWVKLVQKRMVSVLSQADNGHLDLVALVKERCLEHGFEERNIYCIVPPYAFDADSSVYFDILGKQCGFDVLTSSAVAWESELYRVLSRREKIMILVAGFDNGFSEGRLALAGVLRSLWEQNPEFYALVCGGEKLAELMFGPRDLSLLNVAMVEEWPELAMRDIDFLARRINVDLKLGSEEIESLLDLTGAHPRLLSCCLKWRLVNGRSNREKYEEMLRETALVWSLFFSGYYDSWNRKRMCSLLGQEELGRYRPWITDPLIRHLYWKNLMVCRNGKIEWRSKLLVDIGSEALGCK